MRAQRLWGSRFDEPQDAVRWLTAVQAQEHPYARWSVGQRTRRTTAAAFDRAFDEGRVLRTHVLRPTWHYVATADLGWLMRLSGPRVSAANATRYRQLGLDGNVLNKTNDIIAGAVAGGHLTRRELGAVLARKGISTDGQRLPHILMQAELDAVICSGAMQGKQHTYAAFDERVPDRSAPRGEEALAELAGRFFTTRGPATVRDFAWWSGLAMADARHGLEMVQSDLERLDVDERSYWFAERGTRSPAGTRVDLVQCYDEAIISYSQSRDVLQSRAASFAVPRALDGFTHVLLRDGRLLGHWRLTRTRQRAALETRVRSRLTADERIALTKAIERFSRFLDEPLAH